MQVEKFMTSFKETRQLNTRFHKEARQRYYVSDVEELLAEPYELLDKFVRHHQDRQVPRIQELMDYAHGVNHTISEGKRRRKESSMADNRAVHNFGKAIVKFRVGYLVGNDIDVEYVDNDTGSQKDTFLKELGKEQDFYNLNRQLMTHMAMVGRAYELSYFNHDEQLKTKRLSPEQTFVIYRNDLDEQPLAGIYYYQKQSLSDKELVIMVYTDNQVWEFIRDESGFHLKSNQLHGFDEVPIIEHMNDEEGMGVYESELSLIDLYDAAQSDTANHMTDLTDAILFIFGRVGFPENLTADQRVEYLEMMREARLMQLEPPVNEAGEESGEVDAKYLYKQYDVEGTEAYKNRLEKNIHEFTSTPDLNDLHFSGNQSGEAMKYKLFGLEQERASTEALFKAGLLKRYRLIVGLSSKVSDQAGMLVDFDVNNIRITFTPNLPQSNKEIVEMVQMIHGISSDETLLSILKQVTDVEAADELERIKREAMYLPEPRLDVMQEVGGDDGQSNE